MFLLTMILACGSKSIETEKVSTSDAEAVTTEAGAATAGTASSATTSKTINTTNTGNVTSTNTANTNASVTIVKPAENTVEAETPMDDHNDDKEGDE